MAHDIALLYMRTHRLDEDLTSEEAFLHYLTREYSKNKQLLAEILERHVPIVEAVATINPLFTEGHFEKWLRWGNSESEAFDHFVEGSRELLFDLAVGLFTVGRLDVVDDILMIAKPAPPSGGRPDWTTRFLGCFSHHLPLPGDVDPVVNPEDIRVWLQKHRQELAWDDSCNCYRWIA